MIVTGIVRGAVINCLLYFVRFSSQFPAADKKVVAKWMAYMETKVSRAANISILCSMLLFSFPVSHSRNQKAVGHGLQSLQTMILINALLMT